MTSEKNQLTLPPNARFEIRGSHHLLELGNPALSEVLRSGSRALIIVEKEEAQRAHKIEAWFRERRRTGHIQSFQIHAVGGDVKQRPLEGALEIIRAGIDGGLRRHDSFVSAGGPAITDMTGFAAAISRRSMRCVRLHNDWEGLTHSIRRGAKAQLGTDAMGATGHEVWCFADYSGIQEERVGQFWRAEEHSPGPTRSYSVEFTTGIFDFANPLLESFLIDKPRVLAFVDAYPGHRGQPLQHYLERLRVQGKILSSQVEFLRVASSAKDMKPVLQVLDRCQSAGISCEDVILVVGGGTLMDIVGFAAALHRGGCRYIRIPTTLVGMIDAGIGLKVGVNFEYRKNFVGAYFPPVACLCDPQLLDTLPMAEMKCGLAEAIKIAAVCNAELFALIEKAFAELMASPQSTISRQIMVSAISEMLEELEANPYEKELRRLPDFGHEFAHIIEGLDEFQIRHGEAVSIGMALSINLAWRAGLLARADMDRVLNLLLQVGLPVTHSGCDPNKLWQKILGNVVPNKAGNLHLAVPDRIGHGTYLEDISPQAIEDACHDLKRLASERIMG